MRRKFQRMTKQRKVILDVLRGTKTHPAADWIYEKVRRRLPNVSLGTVYRNLNLLADMGEIMELNYGSSHTRFDGNPVNHYHFVCSQCGNCYDLDYPLRTELEEEARQATGHLIQNHRLEFYGICEKCQETGRKEKI